jgi:hypothetical protein
MGYAERNNVHKSDKVLRQCIISEIERGDPTQNELCISGDRAFLKHVVEQIINDTASFEAAFGDVDDAI